MNTPPLLLIIFPVSNIFLSNIAPVHGSHSTLNILSPFSFKIVSRWIVIHLSITMFHVIFEITFKNASTLKNNLTFSFFLAFNPITLISCIIDIVFPNTMTKTILYFALIIASIWPFISPLSSDTIISKLSLINNSIGPSECAFSAQQSIEEVPLISISIFKGNFSRSIETLTINFAILRRGSNFSLPFFVEYFCQLDWQHHAIAH